jgi:CRP/FNR family cyclic AMP-dependent transcriptional regulator
VTESEPSSGSPTHRALFPWFPAHQIAPSQQLRTEALIGHIPLFSEVPPHRLRAIAQIARRTSYSAGQVVFRTGELGSTLHVIRSGRMNVVREYESGEAVVLASLGPGEFFGELALFDQGPRSATVVAAEDTETISLGRTDILDLINRYPDVALAFLQSLSTRLRSADNLLENYSRATPSETGNRINF